MEKSTKKQTGGVLRAIGKYLWGFMVTLAVLSLVALLAIDLFGIEMITYVYIVSLICSRIIVYKLYAYIAIGIILLITIVTAITTAVKNKIVVKKADRIAIIRQEAVSEVNRKFIDADDPQEENE